MTGWIINKFAIVGFMVPLGAEGLIECGADFGRFAVHHPAQPDMEEIHQVTVGYRVIIGWIGEDDIVIGFEASGAAPIYYDWRRSGIGNLQRMGDKFADPFYRPIVSP